MGGRSEAQRRRFERLRAFDRDKDPGAWEAGLLAVCPQRMFPEIMDCPSVGKYTFWLRKYFTNCESPPRGPPAYSTVADSTDPRDGSIALFVVFLAT